jgi:1-deoxy-D-xylulose-5-phosphate synthase
MLSDALDLCTGPSAIRFPKTPPPTDGGRGSGLSGRRVRHGSAVCIIGVGKMLQTALDAADLLAADGVTATVWDPRVVKPLDSEMLADAATHELVVTIEDGLRDGGVGMAIADQLCEITVGRPEPRVRVLGIPGAYVPHGKPDAILAELGLDAAGVFASAMSLMAADHPHDASV